MGLMQPAANAVVKELAGRLHYLIALGIKTIIYSISEGKKRAMALPGSNFRRLVRTQFGMGRRKTVVRASENIEELHQPWQPRGPIRPVAIHRTDSSKFKGCVCEWRRRRPDCAHAQSGLGLRCSHVT